MKLYPNTYYHLYNRTINEEALFCSRENYIYFLKKYRYYLYEYFETFAYCLMPTHYHFLIRVKDVSASPHSQTSEVLKTSEVYPVKTSDVSTIPYHSQISKAIQKLHISYSKAFNKKYSRHGSLFQAKPKAKPIEDESYLITLLTYIHQNPTRSHLVEKAEAWEFSSYQDYLGLRNGTLPSKNLILSTYSKMQLKEITDIPIRIIDTQYWV